MTVAEAFQTFKSELEIPDQKQKLAASAQQEIRSRIAEHLFVADSILAQKLAQVEGVGQVFSWGSSRPAVRVSVNPNLINSYGISLETVRRGLQADDRLNKRINPFGVL